MNGLRAIWAWVDDRLGVRGMIAPAMTHKVPRSAKWWYVFGSATLMFFGIQVCTGIVLATMYAPSAADAWASLEYIDQQVPFGWLLRALHGWSSNAMVLMMAVHMSQVFLHATYRFPRELTWMVGVGLAGLTLALAFTGQVMRWDQDAYWGLGIGAAIVDRIPLVGNQLRNAMLGGPIIGGETLSRFFALHVFVLPGLTIAMVGAHLMMVLRKGISEMPRAGEPVEPATYEVAYHERIEKQGVPFWPDAAQRDLVFCGSALIVVMALAIWFGPFGPRSFPDPTLINTNPRPDYPFLWIFGAVSLLPPASETVIMLVAPAVLGAMLIGLPLVFRGGERAPSRRPAAMLGFVLILTALGVLTWQGISSPWSPQMDAWSSEPVPAEQLMGRTALEVQGAVVIQFAQCRNCHSLGGRGGRRGPALDEIAMLLSPDQMIRQVQQGSGNMPAYGKNLSSAQTEAVVAFLSTMKPRGTPGAQPPVR